MAAPVLIALALGLIHGLGALGAIDAVLRTRTSQGAIAWAVSLACLPYVALPLYLVLGRSRFHGFLDSQLAAEKALHASVDEVTDALSEFVIPVADAHPVYQGLAALARMPASRGNKAELLIDGQATFDSIIAGILAAERYVLVEFYIVRSDGLGNRLKDALIDRARAGLRCFLLYDELGSMGLPRAFLKELRDAGVSVSAFNTTRGFGNRFQLNFRNHRKIVVTDGRTTWIGGHNVGDDYLGLYPKVGPWRDTHCRVDGPAALGAQLTFRMDWRWATGELLEFERQPMTSSEFDGPAKVLVFPSNPSSHYEEAGMLFHQAIMAARQRIWIASPYFVPDEGIVVALQIAALRGVDVRVVVPDVSDNAIVNLAGWSYVDELEASGVTLLRYREGFMHQKVFLVDDSLAGVGTANFDNRSFRLNFEVMLLVAEESFVKEVEAMLLADFARSGSMTREDLAAKPFWFPLPMRLARLCAPVL